MLKIRTVRQVMGPGCDLYIAFSLPCGVQICVGEGCRSVGSFRAALVTRFV